MFVSVKMECHLCVRGSSSKLLYCLSDISHVEGVKTEIAADEELHPASALQKIKNNFKAELFGIDLGCVT